MDNLKDFFFNDAEAGSGSEDMLLKAISAGYGTNAADFTGGRALQPEDCESTLINVMREQEEDFKLMNTIKKTPVKSTVHQFNLRTDVGDEDIGFVGEGKIAPENNQNIQRVTRDMKYIQKLGEVTEQAIIVDTFENAFEAEKIATTLSVLRTAEKYCFHGDSAVVPKQFDGLIAQVKNAPPNKRNVRDLRGNTIASAGDGVFTKMAAMIADHGGEANKVFYPLILGQDIQELCKDRLRFGTEDDRMSAVFKSYPTLFGSLAIAGDAGPDKMFRPKGIIKPSGVVGTPKKPTSVRASILSNAAGSKFVSSTDGSKTDAGRYNYTVHAVNEYGISEGTSLTNDAGVQVDGVMVNVGSGVKLTITPDPDIINPCTGFIICRSSKDGDVVMEMTRIGRGDEQGKTVFTDLNEDLPGTAEMLFITEKKMQAVVEFLQLLPLRLYRMNPVNRLVTPFVMSLWGTPSIKAPHWCGIVKNIGYHGGLSNA